MSISRRQKRVSSLLKAELSRLFLEMPHDNSSLLITITKVDMTSDLKTAHVYLSIFSKEPEETILDHINEKKGYFRKSIASKTKLKYNPMLIFSLDPAPGYEKQIDKLIDSIKKNEKEFH